MRGPALDESRNRGRTDHIHCSRSRAESADLLHLSIRTEPRACRCGVSETSTHLRLTAVRSPSTMISASSIGRFCRRTAVTIHNLERLIDHISSDGERTTVRFLLCLLLCAATIRAADPPNIVLIFVDNFGNGDLACFGSQLHRTPHVDQLAAEGMKFTSFYVSSGVCTPSRASLMTGCYPRRVNMHVSDRNSAVLQPVSPKGLHPGETTIAEVLKSAGYATACIGKWHLGDQPAFLPTRQGFDEFFGIPYSDDMTKDKRPEVWPELPLMQNERVIEAPAERTTLVQRCTEQAVSFIERHQRQPFFLYVPHTMPGSTPHPFASEAFQGRSQNGKYGDAVEELDWSTGQIMAALQRLQLDRNTLFIWTSDNGAVRRNPPQGSCAPYRGFGYNTSEGAMRMPCVMRWPDRIPAGRTCDALCSTLDLLPTLAGLASAELPTQPIDGLDLSKLLTSGGLESPRDEPGMLFYMMDQLQAVRSGPWKLYLPLAGRYSNLSRLREAATAELYNVRKDVGELQNVAADYPDVVARLQQLAEQGRMVLGDEERAGSGQRPAGWVETPQPLTMSAP